MSEVTVTVKIKLLPDKEAQASLLASMEQYRLACNFIRIASRKPPWL